MKKNVYSKLGFLVLSFVIALTSCNTPKTNVNISDKKSNSNFSIKTLVPNYNMTESECNNSSNGYPVYDYNYLVNSNCGWRGETNGRYECITCETGSYCFNWATFASQRNIPATYADILNYFNNEVGKKYLYCNVNVVTPPDPNATPTPVNSWTISLSISGEIIIVDQKNLPVFIVVTPSETTNLWDMTISSNNGYSKTYSSNTNVQTIRFPDVGSNIPVGSYTIEVHYWDDQSISDSANISVLSTNSSSTPSSTPTPTPTVTPTIEPSPPVPTNPPDPPPIPNPSITSTPTPTSTLLPSPTITKTPDPVSTESPIPSTSSTPTPTTEPTSSPSTPLPPTPTATPEICPIDSDWVITE